MVGFPGSVMLRIQCLERLLGLAIPVNKLDLSIALSAPCAYTKNKPKDSSLLILCETDPSSNLTRILCVAWTSFWLRVSRLRDEYTYRYIIKHFQVYHWYLDVEFLLLKRIALNSGNSAVKIEDA